MNKTYFVTPKGAEELLPIGTTYKSQPLSGCNPGIGRIDSFSWGTYIVSFKKAFPVTSSYYKVLEIPREKIKNYLQID
jgi:hypothetical protein